MNKKSKWLLGILSLTLTTGLMAGCSNGETTESRKDLEERPNMVQESSIKVEDTKLLVTQTGFLNGFPEKKLVEFKVIKDTTQTLRIFEMGEEIAEYLSEEKQDGKTEFTLTYQESKDGITNPILVKIEKK